MKKPIKIVVSVLLSVLILLSIAWYLFEYDPGFTRDFLLHQARNYEAKGRNKIAVWLYDLAYHQADQDDSVAMELAEYYRSIGNYSKAEHTLSNAIADGGDVELYIALCKLFVEQDKLLDAVTMLDHISAPEIQAQLASLRPKAPTVSHTPGVYTHFIHVQFSSAEGSVYLTTGNDYPSVAQGAITAPLSPGRGETTYYAVTVAENGLVSPLAEYTYTISDVIEPVHFSDTAFDLAIRELLSVEEDEVIYSDTLWAITRFQMPTSSAGCEDLIWLPNLEELIISGCAFQDLRVLSHLSALQTLTIQDCVISTEDLARIAALPVLRSLTLSGCYLSTISNLDGAGNLTYLNLSRNSIRDISVLSQFTQLEYLDLSENALISLEALACLTNLQTLDVSYNSLINTDHISALTQLTKLNISANDLMNTEIMGIEQLTNLTWFAASHNNLVHINFLKDCLQLKTLIVSDNTIYDLNIIHAHTALEYLDFSYNEVEKLPRFSADCPLAIINGGYNQLKSLDQLSVLQKLEYIYMDYNKNIKKIDKLINCSSLKQINVYGTGVYSVSKLLDAGIIVNYKPV